MDSLHQLRNNGIHNQIKPGRAVMVDPQILEDLKADSKLTKESVSNLAKFLQRGSQGQERQKKKELAKVIGVIAVAAKELKLELGLSGGQKLNQNKSGTKELIETTKAILTVINDNQGLEGKRGNEDVKSCIQDVLAAYLKSQEKEVSNNYRVPQSQGEEVQSREQTRLDLEKQEIEEAKLREEAAKQAELEAKQAQKAAMQAELKAKEAAIAARKQIKEYSSGRELLNELEANKKNILDQLSSITTEEVATNTRNLDKEFTEKLRGIIRNSISTEGLKNLDNIKDSPKKLYAAIIKKYEIDLKEAAAESDDIGKSAQQKADIAQKAKNIMVSMLENGSIPEEADKISIVTATKILSKLLEAIHLELKPEQKEQSKIEAIQQIIRNDSASCQGVTFSSLKAAQQALIKIHEYSTQQYTQTIEFPIANEDHPANKSQNFDQIKEHLEARISYIQKLIARNHADHMQYTGSKEHIIDHVIIESLDALQIQKILDIVNPKTGKTKAAMHRKEYKSLFKNLQESIKTGKLPDNISYKELAALTPCLNIIIQDLHKFEKQKFNTEGLKASQRNVSERYEYLLAMLKQENQLLNKNDSIMDEKHETETISPDDLKALKRCALDRQGNGYFGTLYESLSTITKLLEEIQPKQLLSQEVEEADATRSFQDLGLDPKDINRKLKSLIKLISCDLVSSESYWLPLAVNCKKGIAELIVEEFSDFRGHVIAPNDKQKETLKKISAAMIKGRKVQSRDNVLYTMQAIAKLSTIHSKLREFAIQKITEL